MLRGGFPPAEPVPGSVVFCRNDGCNVGPEVQGEYNAWTAQAEGRGRRAGLCASNETMGSYLPGYGKT